jgi:hypothetical protein
MYVPYITFLYMFCTLPSYTCSVHYLPIHVLYITFLYMFCTLPSYTCSKHYLPIHALYITFLYMFCTLPSISTTYIFITGSQYLQLVSFTFKSYVQLSMNLRNDGPILILTHSDECKFKNTTSMQILRFVMFKYRGGGM